MVDGSMFWFLMLKACCVAEHLVEVFLVKDWLEQLGEKHPDIATEILHGPLKIESGYEKIGNRIATPQFVIDVLMLNIGSNTDGCTLNILHQDINTAKQRVCHHFHPFSLFGH
jgi:hypothetical protein